MSDERSAPVGAGARSVQGAALRTVELIAGYGGSPVLHGVSIAVEPGEVVSIVGPNGSGKSTLLKGVVGIVEIQSGRVLVGDQDVTGWSPEDVARIGVGYVPQIDDVFAPLTVRENLEMGGYLLKSREVAAAGRARARGVPAAGADAHAARGQAQRRRAQDAGDGARPDARAGARRPRRADREPRPARSPARCCRSTSANSPAPAPRCSSSSSARRPCWRSPTAPTCSSAASCGWRGRPSELAASSEFVDSFLGGGQGPPLHAAEDDRA